MLYALRILTYDTMNPMEIVIVCVCVTINKCTPSMLCIHSNNRTKENVIVGTIHSLDMYSIPMKWQQDNSDSNVYGFYFFCIK